MTERNPLPLHLQPIATAAEVRAYKQASLWVLDSLRTMQTDSREAKWARGAAAFIWQLADERDDVPSPWRTDLHVPKESGWPVMLGRRRSELVAMGMFSGAMWRHTESLDPVRFEPDVWQPLPKPPGA